MLNRYRQRILLLSVLLGFAPLGFAFDLFGTSCLEDLEENARLWSQCTAKFDRNDSRCKAFGHEIEEARARCERGGKSKARIDAAMNAGFRTAGRLEED
jgi:hypothetical protein